MCHKNKKQKFEKFTFVHVSADLGQFMEHFPCDFVGIVRGTYSQLCPGFCDSDITSYSIYKVENGQVTNNISWYYEKQLTKLPDQNLDKARKMVDEYRTVYGEK